MTDVIPAHVADVPPLVDADTFDISVLFHDGPARKPHPQRRPAAHEPWTSTDGFPPAYGWYAPARPGGRSSRRPRGHHLCGNDLLLDNPGSEPGGGERGWREARAGRSRGQVARVAALLSASVR